MLPRVRLSRFTFLPSWWGKSACCSSFQPHFADVSSFDQAESAEDMRKCLQSVYSTARDYHITMNKFVESGNEEIVRELLSEMKVKGIPRSERTYSILIKAYIKSKKRTKTQNIIQEMLDDQIQPDEYTMTQMLQHFLNEGDLSNAESLFNVMKRDRRLMSEIGLLTITNGYVHAGLLDKAHKLLLEVSFPSMRIYFTDKVFNTLMAALVKKKAFAEVTELFDTMKRVDIIPTVETYNILVKSEIENGIIEKAEKIIEEMKENYLLPTSATYGNLVVGYSRAGLFDKAENIIFHQKHPVDQYSYNALIHGYLQKKRPLDAKRIFNRMKEKEVKPDIVTYNILMQDLVEQKKFMELKHLYSQINSTGTKPNEITYNLLISSYCKINKIKKAKEILETFKKQTDSLNSRPYTPILYYYSRRGDIKETVLEFDQMVADGVTPCEYAFNALIHCYVPLGDYEKVRVIMRDMSSCSIRPTLVTSTLLLKTYVEASCLDKAKEFFLSLRTRFKVTIVTYGVLMFGYIKEGTKSTGTVAKVQELFSLMKEDHLVPNAVLHYYLVQANLKDGNSKGFYAELENMKRKKFRMEAKMVLNVLKNFLSTFKSESPEKIFLYLVDTGFHPDPAFRNAITKIANQQHRGPETMQYMKVFNQ